MAARVLAPLLLLACACGEPDGPPRLDDRSRFVDCAVDVTVDELDDGAIEVALHPEYDAYGFVTWQEQDDGADGTLDVERSDLNDRFGNPIETRYDGDADGFADYLVYGEYDADGNPLRIEEDSDGDGTIDELSTYVVVDGLVRSGEWGDGAGLVYHEYSWEYDELGREVLFAAVDPDLDQLLWEETIAWHGDTGVATSSTFTEYALGGNIFRSITWEVELDAQLRVLGYHMVDEVLGEPNATLDRTYTYRGELHEPSAMDEAATAGGEPLYARQATWRYDAARRVVEEVYAGGTADGVDLTSRSAFDWSCP